MLSMEINTNAVWNCVDKQIELGGDLYPTVYVAQSLDNEIKD